MGKKKVTDGMPWDGRTVSPRGISFRADAGDGAPLSLQLAAAILGCLRTGERPAGLELGAVWKKGETF